MSTELLNPRDPAVQPSFSVGNRVRRTIWNLTYAILFRPSPRPLHAWRAFLLRLFGAQIGRGCHVYPKVRIWAPWNLVVEDLAGVADDVTLYSMGKITLGERCVVSQGAHLCAGTHDYNDPSFRLIALPIVIGSKAWICAEAFVGPGVTVGEGAVIGARSVVIKDAPPWMVCAGNPCRPIKRRQPSG
jgi:putative colanic acid biosynthesis acetyltransferase WcaF